jgi:hypothetical protein
MDAGAETGCVVDLDEGQLMSLVPPTPMRALTANVTDPKAKRALEANSQALVEKDPHRIEIRDLTKAMRDAQLTSVTMIDWPAVEERVIDGLKRIEADHRRAGPSRLGQGNGIGRMQVSGEQLDVILKSTERRGSRL